MPPRFLSVLVRHLALGVPLSAALHTAVQTAADRGDHGVGMTLLHFLAGATVGAVILAPAYSVQALMSWGLARRKAPAPVRGAVGGLFQAFLVLLWAGFVGIEPSLPGRFPMTLPMIAAGLLAGATVGAVAMPRPRADQ